MKTLWKIAAAACAVAAASCESPSGTAKAWAQSGAYMSCDQLWRARNEIYARNGYCFTTERAQAVFGSGCFPPYGRLSGWEKARVNELQMWERRKGC